MKVVAYLILTLVLVVAVQAQAPAPAADQAAQPTPQDRVALDLELVNIQLRATKDFALNLQAENRRLTEENKGLKDQLAKLQPAKK